MEPGTYDIGTRAVVRGFISYLKKYEDRKATNREPDNLSSYTGGLLDTDADLGFLMGLKETEIETLVACIRNRVEEVGK